MTDLVLDRTRRDLHAVAELVLAGSQYLATGRIGLRVSPGGFRTAAQPDLRVVGTDVVAGGARYPISGGSARSLAAAAGAIARGLEDVYGEGSGVALEQELAVDPAAARRISDAFEMGEAALRLVAPDEDPTLWPEHFDVGIRVGGVNYGISPGDGRLGEPYAYVGVDPVPDDPFWNAPFGAARPMAGFADIAAVRDFLLDGRDRFAARRA
jgi:hypothetical protein